MQQALFHTSTILDGEQGYFVTPFYENLGGVALFQAEMSGEGLRYKFALYPNPMARSETSLPITFVDRFQRARTAHS